MSPIRPHSGAFHVPTLGLAPGTLLVTGHRAATTRGCHRTAKFWDLSGLPEMMTR